MSRGLWIFVCLLGLATVGAAQETRPPVYFNHLSITVPEGTFKALAATPFLCGEFAGCEQRTTVVDGGMESYSGIYLYGEKTYIEFVLASGADAAGDIGLGMSVDDRAAMPELQDFLQRQLKVPVKLEKRTRHVGAADVDWFDYLYADWLAGDELSLWVMAYYPDYFTAIHAESTATTRENNLAQLYRHDLYLKNVKRLVLWNTQSRIDAVSGLLLSLGWDLYADGKVVTFRGAGMEIIFVPVKANEPSRLEIDFDLNRKYAGALEYRFPDDSELVFASHIARWTFPAPPKPGKAPPVEVPEKTSKK